MTGAHPRLAIVTGAARNTDRTIALAKALAVAFGDRGVTANRAMPAEIETERGALPCQPDAGCVTGQTVRVNGGGYLP